MKHKSNKLIRVVKRTLFAAVILLLAANLFQYFAEPQPVDVLQNPRITLLTKEARPGDTISYHITAQKNTSQDATSTRVLVCEVGSGAYTNISLKGSTQSNPEGKIDQIVYVELKPTDGAQIPPEAYDHYCYLRNSATYPKVHKQFTLFGLGDYVDSDGVDDGFTTYVYDSYNCRDRAGECDRSQMLKLLPPLDEHTSPDTTGSTSADPTLGVLPKNQSPTATQEGKPADDDDDNTTPTPQPPSVLDGLVGFVNGVLGGAYGLVNGIIRP